MSHANRGVAAEAAIERIHAGYRACGHYVQRNATHYRVVGKGQRGELRVVPGAESPPDWIVVAHGWSFLLDVKQAAGDTWPFANLEPHQARSLDLWEAQSPRHRAGLVIALNGLRVIAWLPWRDLRSRWWAWHRRTSRAAPGTAALSLDDLAPYRLTSFAWLACAVAMEDDHALGRHATT